MTDRIIATVRDYDGLVAALRARVAELNIAGETVDRIAGLPDRYTSKLFAPIPIKGMGRVSLGPMLGALGLKIIVVEDAEAMAKVAARLQRKEEQYASTGMRPQERHVNKGDSQWSKILNCRRSLMLTPRQRSKLAKRAAAARWAQNKRT